MYAGRSNLGWSSDPSCWRSDPSGWSSDPSGWSLVLLAGPQTPLALAGSQTLWVHRISPSLPPLGPFCLHLQSSPGFFRYPELPTGKTKLKEWVDCSFFFCYWYEECSSCSLIKSNKWRFPNKGFWKIRQRKENILMNTWINELICQILFSALAMYFLFNNAHFILHFRI